MIEGDLLLPRMFARDEGTKGLQDLPRVRRRAWRSPSATSRTLSRTCGSHLDASSACGLRGATYAGGHLRHDHSETVVASCLRQRRSGVVIGRTSDDEPIAR